MKSYILLNSNIPFLGVKYSPCHTKFLVASTTSKIYSYDNNNNVNNNNNNNVNNKTLLCTVTEPEGSIYDFAWYPYTKPSLKESYIFLSTGSGLPIHLWDANNGILKASYCGINKNTEEHMSAISLSFNTHGNHIYAGYNREILIFDANCPSTILERRPTCKTRKSKHGQRGLLSTIAFSPDFSGMYAVGSYNGSVCLYEENSGDLLLDLKLIEEEQFNNSSFLNDTTNDGSNKFYQHNGGITQLAWSPNGHLLLAGKRKDDTINVYDIRGAGNGKILYKLKRPVNNNQRIYFDIDPSGKYVFSGSTDHSIYIYSLETGKLVYNNTQTSDDHRVNDVINGFSLNKGIPTSVSNNNNNNSITFSSGSSALVTTGSRETQFTNDDEEEKKKYTLCEIQF